MVSGREYIVSIQVGNHVVNDVWDGDRSFLTSLPGDLSIAKTPDGFALNQGLTGEHGQPVAFFSEEEALTGKIIHLLGKDRELPVQVSVIPVEARGNLTGPVNPSFSKKEKPDWSNGFLVVLGSKANISKMLLVSNRKQISFEGSPLFVVLRTGNGAQLKSLVSGLRLVEDSGQEHILDEGELIELNYIRSAVIHFGDQIHWWKVVPLGDRSILHASALQQTKRLAGGLLGAVLGFALLAAFLWSFDHVSEMTQSSPVAVNTEAPLSEDLKLGIIKSPLAPPPEMALPEIKKETQSAEKSVTPTVQSPEGPKKSLLANTPKAAPPSVAAEKKAPSASVNKLKQALAALNQVTPEVNEEKPTPESPSAVAKKTSSPTKSKSHEMAAMETVAKSLINSTSSSSVAVAVDDQRLKSALKATTESTGNQPSLASIKLLPTDFKDEEGAPSEGNKDKKAEIIGGLTKGDVESIIGKSELQIRNCYQAALSSHPGTAGKVVLNFLVTEQGKVSVARVAQSTLTDPKMNHCLVALAKDWEFPRPADGRRVNVSYPLSFELLRSKQ